VRRGDADEQGRGQSRHHPGQVTGDLPAKAEHSKQPAAMPVLRPRPDPRPDKETHPVKGIPQLTPQTRTCRTWRFERRLSGRRCPLRQYSRPGRGRLHSGQDPGKEALA
jgi:hypothetical protein